MPPPLGPPPENITGLSSSTTFVALFPGSKLLSKAAAGREVLSRLDTALTFRLCDSRPSDLERAASFIRAGGVSVRPGETPSGRRRSLLQAAQNGTGDESLTPFKVARKRFEEPANVMCDVSSGILATALGAVGRRAGAVPTNQWASPSSCCRSLLSYSAA
ncbi:hypothetical protein KFL_001250080 [Klebsormidium nitens]|uniref:Uncharacterized protein n=1 Tax=Klebsormidium nitens TaxID=105231 RepID=A0A1Y1HYK3_KLENI|nr:hypothetical protein KFL_001250080 [Klebsormidium nitens]|eukprot:GAQ82812.1 hypothetical protein KFL_001250080 [Klebsormidium nitens]